MPLFIQPLSRPITYASIPCARLPSARKSQELPLALIFRFSFLFLTIFYTKTKWEADAGNLSDFGNFDTFVYRNGSVSSFLDDSGKSFLIAAKGVGKTLLLSYKRYLLENKYDTSLTFIPNQHPYISFVESIKSTLSNEHLSKLENWEYCKRLWVLIIELCLISYSNANVNDILNAAPERVKRYNFSIKHFIFPLYYIFVQKALQSIK